MQLLEQTNDVRGNLAVMFGNYCYTRGKASFLLFLAQLLKLQQAALFSTL